VARNQTTFRPGQSGNPAGRPSTADVAALARRYTAEAVLGLVKCVRLNPAEHGAVVVRAAEALLARGYGAPKQDFGAIDGAEAGPGAHWVAVQQAQDADTGEMVPAFLPAAAGDADMGDLGMLPIPNAPPPTEAGLALWDASHNGAVIEGEAEQLPGGGDADREDGE